MKRMITGILCALALGIGGCATSMRGGGTAPRSADLNWPGEGRTAVQHEHAEPRYAPLPEIGN